MNSITHLALPLLLLLATLSTRCAGSETVHATDLADGSSAPDQRTGDTEIPFADLSPGKDAGPLPLDATDLALPDAHADLLDVAPLQDAALDLLPVETSVAEVTGDAWTADTAPDLAGDLGPQPPPPLFDAALIGDAEDAACTFTDHETTLKDGVLVDLWRVRFISYESIEGELHPIVMRGFAARPVGGNPLPGVIQAHGLGGFAKAEHATGLAALTGHFVLAYTGPGGGDAPENTSEGLAASYNSGYRMFDVLGDLRGSWFWGHAMAAMRGMTCLAARPDVDASRLGITGFSAGGVISTLVAGVDDRVLAAVPLSGTLAWGVAVQSPDAWQHALLSEAGLSVASAEWQKLLELVDPAAMLSETGAHLFAVNGTSDEFFPLTAHMATWNELPGAEKRLSFAGNFDHGCYLISGGESAQTIEDRAALRANGAQRMWFHHWFGTDDRYEYVPQAPTVEVSALGAATLATAVVDGGGSHLAVEEVALWWSNDDAFLWGKVVLKPQGSNIYGELALFPLQGNTVAFVDVQYKTNELLFPERFSISSPPTLPDGFVPHIRDISSCL